MAASRKAVATWAKRASLGTMGVANIPSPPRRPTMRYSHRGAFRDQVNCLRRQFLQDGGLPFTDVLTAEVIADALATVGRWLDRVFSPVVTLWVFLGQALAADQSCRAAVARLAAHRVARGLAPCSSEAGAYCQARKRLPERFVAAVARRVGRNLDARVDRRWLWKGRRVCLFDGTTVSMPDAIAVREARFRVEQPGFRTRWIAVVTTLLDPEQANKQELASLYRARWNNELDLRSIKVTLQMDVLRCKTPDLVRKEIWAHALAYNLIRTVMAQAAAGDGVPPRSISFKATLQVLEAFRPLIAFQR